MGESEVLLCPHHYLEDTPNGKLEELKIQLRFILPVPDNSASQSYLSIIVTWIHMLQETIHTNNKHKRAALVHRTPREA